MVCLALDIQKLNLLMALISFWGVFWIDATDEESAKRSFLEVAECCNATEKSIDAT